MINFRKVELEDQKAYKPYMAQQQCRSCECTFANLPLVQVLCRYGDGGERDVADKK